MKRSNGCWNPNPYPPINGPCFPGPFDYPDPRYPNPHPWPRPGPII